VKRALAVAALLGVVGCRPDPGKDNYANQEPFPDGGNVSKPGPYPYVPGDKRLSVGDFYEGDYSDVIPIDNTNTHLFIYGVGTPPNQMNTANDLSSPDCVEGVQSDDIVNLGLGFVGLGINYVNAAGTNLPHDLSAWSFMHVSFKSASMDPTSAYATATLQVGMNATTVWVLPSTYGYANDGAWHSLTIPLADFVAGGIDLTMVDAPFVINGGAGTTGDSLLIDDLYFTDK
jgi:hypothetical protein